MLRIFDCMLGADLAAYHVGKAKASEAIDVTGRWFGTGAELLELRGEVDARAFRRLCNHRHPKTNKFLKQRKTDDARSAYDLVFSAPKSVSLMALVLGDERILATHDSAVEAAIVEAEKNAMVRVRRDGANYDRITEMVVGAEFRHFTSRENDPQIHTHCVIFNATRDVEEEEWKALQAGQIYRCSSLFTEVYRSTLRKGLRRLGYATHSTGSGFEITGICQATCDIFSKRNKEIRQIEASLSGCRSPKLREGIARKCRKAKTVIELERLQEGWLKELSVVQSNELDRTRRGAVHPIKGKRVSTRGALNRAAQHLFERDTVVSVSKFLAEALRCGEGYVDLTTLQMAIPGHPSLVMVDGKVTTRRAVFQEVDLLSSVTEGKNAMRPLAVDSGVREGLSEEQMFVLNGLLTCPDRIFSLTGAAGTGKSFIIRHLHSAAKQAGITFQACAPTKKAKKVLQSHGLSDAHTLSRLLSDGELQAKCEPGGVILLDEAGMASMQQMHALVAVVKERGCRLILCGDSSQHRSVEAGDAFRILEERSSLFRVGLRTIQRQRNGFHNKAVEYLWKGHVEAAFCLLYKLEAIHEVPNADERYRRMAEEFADRKKTGASCLVVCSTHREIDCATESIRGVLKKNGVICAEDHSLQIRHPLFLTEAHSRECHSYQPGDMIIPQKKQGGFQRGTRLVVKEVGPYSLHLETPVGDVWVDPRQFRRIAVFRPRMMTCSVGDELLIRKAGRSFEGKAIAEGERVRIEEFEEGSILISGSRRISVNFGHLQLAYATTTQCSQGDTVDYVFSAIDARSARHAASYESIYVAASRGREACSFYIENEREFKNAMLRSSRRPGIMDIF